MKITATVITLNEEHNIAAALETLAWADEIVVVDSQSGDRTVEIARTFTDRVYSRPWPGYSAQKNYAAEQATNDWIFSLDADERVSNKLAEKLQQLKRGSEPEAAAYRMPRLTFYLGRWIKHSGWRPDHKLRLYHRKRAHWQGDYVHETLQANGEVRMLTGDILHYTVRDAGEHHLRMNRYTTLAAQQKYSQGKRATLASLFVSPVAVFLRSYIFKLGFLDGIPGLAIARFAAHYEFLKNLKLWEMGKKEEKRDL
jgi:glycosyltransferase involved in cell wall biosynthesis